MTDRKQLVSLYGRKSTLLSLDIGVIQGSVVTLLYVHQRYHKNMFKLQNNTIRRRHDVHFLAQKFSRIREKN